MRHVRKKSITAFPIIALTILLFVSISFAESAWRFVVACDSRGSNNGVNATILSELADEFVKQHPDLVIFPGDLVSGNNPSESVMESQFRTWRNIMKPVYDAGVAVYPCRGNHDDDNVNAWNNVFGDLPSNGPAGQIHMTYSVVHKNALIISLDQFVNPHRVNQPWLDDQLANNTKPHIFVFAHEPAFKVYHSGGPESYPDNRDVFWRSIADAGCRMYFCGDDHFYNHAHIDDNDGNPQNDVHQFVVGTAGAPLYDWAGVYDGNNTSYLPKKIFHDKRYGYLLVEVDGLEVTAKWMARTAPGVYQVSETWNYTAVPEPATIVLLLAGAGFVAYRQRRIFHLACWESKD